MKKAISLLLTVIMVIGVLGACAAPAAPAPAPAPAPAAPSAPSQPSAPSAPATPAPAQPQKLVKEFKLGYINAPIGPMYEAALKFGELLLAATNGAYGVKQYPSSQLGNERECTEAVILGTVDMSLPGPTPVSWYLPQYSLASCPFIFKDFNHYVKVWDGEVGQQIASELEKAKGITILDTWYRGPRYLTGNVEMHGLDDLKGLKIRVPEAEITLEAWKMLGTNPTPVSWNELYLALQQGVVEAQENPFEMIQTGSLYDVQKYVMNTAHIASHYWLIVNTKQLNSLPADIQASIKKTAKEAGEYQDKLMLDSEASILADLESKGMTWVEDFDMAPLVEIVSSKIEEKFTGKYDIDIYKKVIATK